MDPILALTLNSMHQDMGCLDKVAMNLVSAPVVGYKRQVVAMRPFSEMVEQGVATEAVSNASEQVRSEVRIDPRPGSIRTTGGALDVAITNDAFFEVQTENGLAYTRQGDFRLDAQGRLVTAHGNVVMGKGGDIQLSIPSPLIDADGSIRDPHAAPGDVSVLGKLRLVQFEKPGALQSIGNGLFVSSETPKPLQDGMPQVKQGALEISNVSSAQEMVLMIQTMRHFESMQKATQGYQEMIGTAIHKLGELS